MLLLKKYFHLLKSSCINVRFLLHIWPDEKPFSSIITPSCPFLPLQCYSSAAPSLVCQDFWLVIKCFHYLPNLTFVSVQALFNIFLRAKYLPPCCVVVLVVSSAAKSNNANSVLGLNWLCLEQTSKRLGLITRLHSPFI